jgi:ribosomal protein L7Ae-like RNA K-turn-binding protein
MAVQSGTSDREAALGMLGLARKAGSVVTGTAATRDALRGGRARLVLTAADASEVQLGKIEGVLGPVPRRIVGTRATLGDALGVPPATAVAVTDRRLAEAILRRLDEPGSAGRSGMKK